MDTPTRTSIKATFRTVIIVSAILLIGLVTTSSAQQTFGDMVKENGFEWLIGNWTSTFEQDQTAQLTYKWAIKDHLICADFKAADYHYHGMVFFSPAEQQVVEVGVDSRGGVVKGTWGPEDMDAVSTTTRTDAKGNVEKIAFIHSKVDDKTMRVALYRLDENGNRPDNAWATMEYKRSEDKPAVKVAVKAAAKETDKTAKKAARKAARKAEGKTGRKNKP